MADLQISGSVDAALDSEGNGTAKLGPTGPQESWSPTNVSVICSTNVSEAVCKVYVGPTATNPFFKDITVDGSTGDATDKCNVPVPKGSFIWAVWTGGDVGATATLNVDGTKSS